MLAASGWLALSAVAPAGADQRRASPVAPASAPRAGLLFASSFADGLDEYPYITNRRRIQVVDDPILGSRRKVLRMQVFNGDTGQTANPRAQLETRKDFLIGQDRYFGFSLYFPRSFPTTLPSRTWVAVSGQAYGPPYAGAGPVSLRVQPAPREAELRWQRNDTYGMDIPWRGPRIASIRGRWVDIVQRISLSRDPRAGFVELWLNTGTGWVRQKLAGRDRLYMRTADSSNGGGPNNSRIGLYYDARIRGPLTVYHGPHRIAAASATAFAAVAPDSYGPPR